MAIIVWESVKKVRCDRLAQEAELLEERIYVEDLMPGVGRPYKVRARKCSLGMDCHLAGFSCRWAYTNPNYDPLAEASATGVSWA